MPKPRTEPARAAHASIEPERTSVTVAEARDLILNSVDPLGSETVGIQAAQGRVLREELLSTEEIPPHDNSAMDGFALRAEDVTSVPTELHVVEELPAGKRSQQKIGPGEAARIMTGAAIPEGVDSVVMVEYAEASGDRVVIQQPVTRGQHIRPAGADVRPGTRIAEVGDLLRTPHVGMMAAIGRTTVRVCSLPRVAILATGDELVEPDRLVSDGRIASSNSYTLQAAVREIGMEAIYLGISPDEPEEIENRFRQALRCDAVISTGGVSVGDRDWIKQVLAGLGGQMRLWRVNMKPGAPLAFVMLDETPVFGLPGNPVSTLVAFEQFVRPSLLKMAGRREIYRPVESAILTETYTKPAGRLHFVRVTLERDASELRATPTREQGSNLLLSMVHADGFAIVPGELTEVVAGTRVPVQRICSPELRSEPGF
ncbi:MAG: molybdopterin molybdotransferase MoeA [bacterium]|nr:molybdopterin molybdotransferase MoeA [bacterium]